MSPTDDTNAARRGSGSNDLLGLLPERAVVATWSLELTCHCPQCGEYVDLLRYPDFWDGRQSMKACEHGTPRTTGMEVHCPNCDAEFEVDCQY